MRDTSKSVQKLAHERELGRAIGLDIRKSLLTNLVESHKCAMKMDAWCNQIVRSIGSPEATKAPADAAAEVRRIIAELCKANLEDPPRKPIDSDCRTDVDANLVRAWQRIAKDPDSAVCEWLLDGAPASLNVLPESCGIFPTVTDEEVNPLDSLCTEYEEFCNYKGVDDDETASSEFGKHLALQRLKSFDTVQDT